MHHTRRNPCRANGDPRLLKIDLIGKVDESNDVAELVEGRLGKLGRVVKSRMHKGTKSVRLIAGNRGCLREVAHLTPLDALGLCRPLFLLTFRKLCQSDAALTTDEPSVADECCGHTERHIGNAEHRRKALAHARKPYTACPWQAACKMQARGSSIPGGETVRARSVSTARAVTFS